MALVGQRIEKGIAGGVVRLAVGAPHGGDRGEQHEVIERAVAGELVQVAGAGGFGREDGGEIFRRERGERLEAGDAGGVKHTAERRRVRLDLGEHAGDVSSHGDVAGEGADANAGGGEFGESGGEFRRGGAAAHEGDVAGAASDEPTGDREAESAGAAGDEVGFPCGDRRGFHRAERVREKAGDEAGGFAPHDEIVVARGQQFLGERGDGSRTDFVEVEQAAPIGRMLEGEGAGEAGERSGGEIECGEFAAGGDGVLGDDPKGRGGQDGIDNSAGEGDHLGRRAGGDDTARGRETEGQRRAGGEAAHGLLARGECSGQSIGERGVS